MVHSKNIFLRRHKIMQQSCIKIPVGMTELANMMAMEKVEVQCFPKIKEVREVIRNYNYHTKTN